MCVSGCAAGERAGSGSRADFGASEKAQIEPGAAGAPVADAGPPPVAVRMATMNRYWEQLLEADDRHAEAWPTVEVDAPAAPADARPAIQAAIDALPESGGTVRLPAGDFELRSPVVIERSNVRLVGAGPGRTTLRFADYAMGGEILDCVEIRGAGERGAVSNVTIAELTIDANYWKQPGSYNPRGIDSDYATDVVVRNVRITRAFVGLTFGLGVHYAVASNVVIDDYHNDGFNVSGDVESAGAGPAAFVGCVARDALNERRGGSPGNRNNAWEIEDGAANIVLIACRVENVSGNGFAVRNHGFYDDCTTGPVTMIGCRATNVDGNGFFVIGNRHPNNVAAVTLSGCSSDSVTTFTKGVRGLMLHDCDFSATTSIGPAENAVVTGSTLRDLTVWSFPVTVDGDADASYVTSVLIENSVIERQLSVFGDVGNVEVRESRVPARNKNVSG
jgi:hypothetical protein